MTRDSIQKLWKEKQRSEKELVEAKKVVEEYKSFEVFLDDVVEESLGILHEGFEDYRNKINELFLDIDSALLILSVALPVVEEVIEVQDIDAPTETLPPTTYKAIIIVEALEAPVDVQPEAPTNQVEEV